MTITIAAPASCARRLRSAQMRELKSRRRDDNPDAPGDVAENLARQHLTFLVGERELLRVVGEDADTVRPGVDQEVDAAPLPFEVEIASFGEDGRSDRKHTLVPRR